MTTKVRFDYFKQQIEPTIVIESVTFTAGAGLTGGGDLSANRTFDIGAGSGMTINANDVALDTAHARNVDHSAVTITAGAGLTGGGTIEATRTLDIGAGTGVTVNANDVAVDQSFSPTWTGTHTFNETIIGAKRIRLTGVSSPAALAASQNDYSIAASVALARLTPAALGSTITGITAGTAGDFLYLINISVTAGDTITLTNEDAASSAANRFILASGTSSVIQPGGAIIIWYDGTSSRWRQIDRIA